MKTGDYVHRDTLIKEGYTFRSYFAYCLVYQNGDNYIFVDLRTSVIKCMFTSSKY